MSAGMRTLVTGGTGFLGSALVRRLVRDGERVRVLDNNWRGLASRLSDLQHEIELVDGDIRDAGAVHRELAGLRPEAIYHCAAAAHLGRSWQHVTVFRR